MKVLIIYYSLNATTEVVAQFVASETGADVEAITSLDSRKGLFYFLKSGYEATSGKCAKIGGIKSKIEDYDIVIIATPVWAGKTSSPINAFLAGFGAKIKNYAIILTRADKKNDYASVTDIFKSKLKKEPLAFLSMSAESVKTESFDAAREFAKTINQLSSKE